MGLVSGRTVDSDRKADSLTGMTDRKANTGSTAGVGYLTFGRASRDGQIYPGNILPKVNFTRIILLGPTGPHQENSMSALPTTQTCTAFEDFQIIARGTFREVRTEIQKLRAQRTLGTVLVFDDDTGETFDLEFDRDPVSEVSPSLQSAPKPARPGRPRLGVIAREVTLLPRHWEWLESQPGGASVALRKLVESARKNKAPEESVRRSIEVAYRFLSVMYGNGPGFEEIARALFRKNWPDFNRLVEDLPRDLKNYLHQLVAQAEWETGAC
jgi:hypothetical protein